METLMKLVDKAEVETEQKVSENRSNTGQVLKELGFTKVSEKILADLRLKEKINNIAKYKYLKITDSMINAYLNTKVKNYNKVHEKKKKKDENACSYPRFPVYYGRHTTSMSPTSLASFWGTFVVNNSAIYASEIIEISKQTCDFYSIEKDTIGQFIWKECPIEQYEGIPPKEVLNKLRVHKDRLLFDYFTIASVETVKDPLLFGRVNGSNDRYFIAQWGEDILLDDII